MSHHKRKFRDHPPQQPVTAQPSSGRWMRLAAPLLILAAGAWAYHNSFSVPFLFDDVSSIEENTNIRHLWPIWRVFVAPQQTGIAGRPLLSLSFALNYAIGGLNPWSYHVVNLAIHVLASLVLYGLIWQTLRSHGLGLAVALLWVVHPLQTQSVTYIIQRAESLMGLWYLLTLYGLVRATPRDGSCRHHARWLGISLLACWLGMATKPVMVTAPLLALLLDRTFLSGSFRAAWQTRRGYYLGLFASWSVLALLVALRKELEPTAGFGLRLYTPWEYLRTQPGVMLHYLRLALWPHPLVIDYMWPIANTWTAVLLPALGLLGLFAGSRWLWRRRPPVGFWVWWVFLILAPSSLIPIADVAVEHRMYLPLAGLVLLVVLGVERLLRRWLASPSLRRGVGCVGLAGSLGVLGLLTIRRNRDYQDELRLWQQTVAARPNNFRAHNNLGMEYAERGDLEAAIRAFEESVRLEPTYATVHHNLGIAMAKQDRYEQAITHYTKALTLMPEFAIAHNSLGRALSKLGRLEEAIREYRRAVELDPFLVEAHNNLGVAYFDQGDLERSIAQYQEAIRLRPEYPQSYNNLGLSLVRLGKPAEAKPYFEAAIQRHPDYADAHTNLAYVLYELGDTRGAITHLREALRIEPTHATARANLSQLEALSQ